jgi:hypothetical protein
MDRIVISINITIYQFPRLQVCPYLIKIGIKISFSDLNGFIFACQLDKSALKSLK